MTRKIIFKILVYIFLVLLAVIVFVPFYWMFIASFKTMAEMYDPNPSLIPTHIDLKNYAMLFGTTDFLKWMANSMIISAGTLLLGLFICSLTGFVFAIYDFRFKKIIFWVILASVTIPEIVIIIPLFVMMANMHLLNTYFALILPYSMNIFGIFFLRQFITVSIPTDIIYSARVDGCREMGIYFRIALPLCKPGLAVLAVFLWLYSWVQYFWPLIMIKTDALMTLPLGLTAIFSNPYVQEYGMLMAGAFLATIPLIILFLFVQDFFVSGLTRGALKG